jgi:pimeloyl-ACP methyl ester carboxylesterase
MLFLHSTPDDRRIWMFQSAHFSNWYRTIAVDLGGYGRSPDIEPGIRSADQAEACWELLDAMGHDKAIIHGNSLGHLVALNMVRQQPGRVLALIVSGCGYVSKPDGFLGWMRRYQDEGIKVRHEQIFDHFAPAAREYPYLKHYADMVVATNHQNTVANLIAMNEGLSHLDGDSLYEAIKCPTLIIAGTLDRTFPNVPELHRRLKGSSLAVIEGAGHAQMIEAPREYDAHCLRWLGSIGLFPGSAQ